MKITKVFFDTEFSGLTQDTELLSIGLVSENGKEFYAELSDYNGKKISKWVKDNVIVNFTREKILTKEQLKKELMKWFSQFEQVELWGDVSHYDWVLFCDIFGGAFNIPSNVYYICFDIATVFHIANINPDISREEFLGMQKGNKHNALYDAKITKQCYDKLLKEFC